MTNRNRAASCRPAFLLICCALFAQPALAAGFQVLPTRAQLDAEQRVFALTLSNSSNRDASIQLELMEWSQPDGQDQYEPTSELLATPPIFTVPAGERQIIRIGLRRPPERSKELSYRLFLQELPPPTPEGFHGLQVVLRMSIPVFVAPAAGAASHNLEWQARVTNEGLLHVSVVNNGNGNAQVTHLKVVSGDHQAMPTGMFYVLPGATHEWLLDGDVISASEATLQLMANINGVDSETRLQIR